MLKSDVATHHRRFFTVWNDSTRLSFCMIDKSGSIEYDCLQARAFYGFQIAIENIHSEMYSLMIDAYVKDTAEKDRLFHAVDHFDSVKRKAEWALKWTSR